MIPQTPLYRNGRKLEKFVMSLCVRVPIRRSIIVCLALVIVCVLVLLTTVNVQASTVIINDQAGVLDKGRVQAEAAQLPVPVLIFTTKTFIGDKDALKQSTIKQLLGQDSIAIGIDTAHRNISIRYGGNVQLSDSQANDAVSAFISNYHNGGNYTSATIAAIDSLKGALGGGGMNPLWIPISILLCSGGIVFIVFAIRRWRRGGSDISSRIGNRKWPLTPDTEPGAWADSYPYYNGNYPLSPSPGGNYSGGDENYPISPSPGGNPGAVVGIVGASGGFGGGSGGGGAGVGGESGGGGAGVGGESGGGGAEGHF